MGDTTLRPLHRRRSVSRWLVAIIALVILFCLYRVFGPNSAIVLSQQTTYITSPLRPDGLPDYEQYARQKQREGVTPENNAAVLLAQALWPCELERDEYEAVLKELGLDEILSTKSALQPVRGDANRKQVLDWMQKASADDSEPDPDSIIERAMEHSWTTQQIPPLATWVDTNQKPLDLIVEASRRPRYYWPSPTLLDNHHDTLISVLLPGTQAVREGARGLSLRTMRRVGDNQLKEAWQDTLAIFRLSDLVAQSPHLVEQLVAMALRGIACQSASVLLSSEHLTNELARQIQRDLDSVAPLTNAATCVDRMDRLMILDSVVYASIYGVDAIDANGQAKASRPAIASASVDWNIVLRKLNGEFDEAAAAMRLPSGSERRRAFEKYNAKIAKDALETKQIGRRISAIFSRDTRSDLVGSIFAALMMPALDPASNAEERTNSVLAMTQLVAALAVYRTSHDAYPERIDALVPAVVGKLPIDSYNGKPFVYKRLADGCLIYTVGVNGNDDGGTSNEMSTFEGRVLEDLEPAEAEALRVKIPSGADDFSIRIPRPVFKLPTAQPAGAKQ